MSESLSNGLQRNIVKFELACDIYNDLSSMWDQMQMAEITNPQIDAHAIKQLTEHHLLRRINAFHVIRADLSAFILNQAADEGLFTLENKKYTNVELITEATNLIKGFSCDLWFRTMCNTVKEACEVDKGTDV